MNRFTRYLESIGYSVKSTSDSFFTCFTKENNSIYFGRNEKGMMPTLVKPRPSAVSYVNTVMGNKACNILNTKRDIVMINIINNVEPEFIYNSMFNKSTLVIYN